MDNEFYTTLAADVGRVLTTGPRADAMLNALDDPWSDEEESVTLPPFALQTPAQRTQNLHDWFLANQQAERAPFQPWDEILARVKALEFKTQKELAAAYRKPAKWITKFKKVALQQKVTTADEWTACFSESKGNRTEKKNKATSTPATKTLNEEEKTDHGKLQQL